MPDAKRERQRQNREAGRAAQLEAASAARKKQARIRYAIIAGMAVLLAVLGAALFGGGDDKKTEATKNTATTAAGASTTLAPTTTANPALAAVTCNDTTPKENLERPTFTTEPKMTIDPAKKYTAIIETTCGKITAELDPKGAPKTVNSFVFLANQKFFDGLKWHRVVKDFVIQGGDPKGTGAGGPGYQLADELPTDGYKIGSLAMANSGPNTNGSQFFVITGPDGPKKLQNLYSRFGMVTGGLDVAQKLESFHPDTETGDGPPNRPLYILSITIKVG